MAGGTSDAGLAAGSAAAALPGGVALAVGGEALVERRVSHAGVADVSARVRRSAAMRVSAAWSGDLRVGERRRRQRRGAHDRVVDVRVRQRVERPVGRDRVAAWPGRWDCRSATACSGPSPRCRSRRRSPSRRAAATGTGRTRPSCGWSTVSVSRSLATTPTLFIA